MLRPAVQRPPARAVVVQNPTRLDECGPCMPRVRAVQSAVNTDRDMLVAVLRCLKQTDFNIAVDIAAHANQKLRDKLGNVLTDIWTRNSSDADAATGQLTSQEDIQTYMKEMLQEHISTNKSVLLKCDNDTLCTWILGFITSWELQYKETPSKYDISENILSVMIESVQYVTPYMKDTVFDVEALERLYTSDFKELRSTLPLLDRDGAVVRFYFRHPRLARYMVLIAGKLLQKRECNRSGSYCSTKQRSDVTRELDRVLCDLKFKMQALDVSEDGGTEEWLLYALDHRSIEKYKARVFVATVPAGAPVGAATVPAAQRPVNVGPGPTNMPFT